MISTRKFLTYLEFSVNSLTFLRRLATQIRGHRSCVHVTPKSGHTLLEVCIGPRLCSTNHHWTKTGADTNFQKCMTRFWGHMYARSVTSDLGCQSPEEGQRIDRKFEVCPKFSCWDHGFRLNIYYIYQHRWTFNISQRIWGLLLWRCLGQLPVLYIILRSSQNRQELWCFSLYMHKGNPTFLHTDNDACITRMTCTASAAFILHSATYTQSISIHNVNRHANSVMIIL